MPKNLIRHYISSNFIAISKLNLLDLNSRTAILERGISHYPGLNISLISCRNSKYKGIMIPIKQRINNSILSRLKDYLSHKHFINK